MCGLALLLLVASRRVPTWRPYSRCLSVGAGRGGIMHGHRRKQIAFASDPRGKWVLDVHGRPHGASAPPHRTLPPTTTGTCTAAASTPTLSPSRHGGAITVGAAEAWARRAVERQGGRGQHSSERKTSAWCNARCDDREAVAVTACAARCTHAGRDAIRIHHAIIATTIIATR